MRKAIYKAVADRLKNQKVGVKFVSLWNRNTEQLSKQKAFRLPAVFVEFEPIEWSQLSRGARSADIRVRLHVVTETLALPRRAGNTKTGHSNTSTLSSGSTRRCKVSPVRGSTALCWSNP